jgi:hypothetical protein
MFNITMIWKRLSAMAIVMLSVAVLVLALSPTAAADLFDKKTIVTFSGPVEIPGKVLPAGTYVFKLLNSASNRNIVQVFDKDEKQVFATILAISAYRLQPTGDTVIRFEERPSDSPQALKAWWYPGDQYGQQFVYPHRRAVQLARQNRESVLSMKDEMTRNILAPNSGINSESVKSLQNTPVNAVNPAGKDVEMEQALGGQKPNQAGTAQASAAPHK